MHEESIHLTQQTVEHRFIAFLLHPSTVNEHGKETLKLMEKLEKYAWLKIIMLVNIRVCVSHVVGQIRTTVSSHAAFIFTAECAGSGSSKTLLHMYQTTPHHVPEDCNLLLSIHSVKLRQPF